METKLKCKRIEKGYSQKQHSYITGISEWTIKEYEQKRRSIDRAETWRVALLADALDCRVEDLLEQEYKVKKFRKE